MKRLKQLAGALAGVGIVCFISAAGNADYYDAMGSAYPMESILKWGMAGFIFIVAALIIYERSER